MTRTLTLTVSALLTAIALVAPIRGAAQAPAAAGATLVLETVKGTIEIETYPKEAPKTVAAIVALVKRGFYNGQRFHRAEKSLIQVGDPQSRNMSLVDWWGRSGSGKSIGAAEISKLRRHVIGAVAMAHSGAPADADSQFYITLRPMPELDGKYTVFGRVIKGLDVAAKVQKADVLKKASFR